MFFFYVANQGVCLYYQADRHSGLLTAIACRWQKTLSVSHWVYDSHRMNTNTISINHSHLKQTQAFCSRRHWHKCVGERETELDGRHVNFPCHPKLARPHRLAFGYPEINCGNHIRWQFPSSWRISCWQQNYLLSIFMFCFFFFKRRMQFNQVLFCFSFLSDLISGDMFFFFFYCLAGIDCSTDIRTHTWISCYKTLFEIWIFVFLRNGNTLKIQRGYPKRARSPTTIYLFSARTPRQR